MEETVYKQMMDNIHSLVYAIQPETHHFVYANELTRKLFGPPDSETVCYSLLFDRSEPCPGCPMAKLTEEKNIIGASMYVPKLQKWVHIEYSTLPMEDGSLLCLCTGSKITETEDNSHMTEEVLNSIRAAAYTVGQEDYKLRFMNQELRNMLPGIQEGDLCYRALWDADRPCSHCPLPMLSDSQPSGNMEVYNSKLKRFLSIDSVRTIQNNSPVVIFTGYDITARMEYEEELRDIAFSDIQLGVKNRAAFMDDISYLLDSGRSGMVSISNLKNFDNCNMVYGRLFGDNLLKTVADYYSHTYIQDNVYRISGAKFALLAVGSEEVERLAAHTNSKKGITYTEEDRSFHVYSDSVLIEFPNYSTSPEMLIHNAEYILSQSKSKDISQVFYFGREEQQQLDRKNEISSIIRRNFDLGHFEVYYQPIYSIADNKITKCEALLRLTDENLGSISPLEFIPIAEETGLINELGTFVLEKACQTILDLQKLGLPPVQINVNISTIQFSQKNFFENVMEILDKYDIARKLIQLEVTESIVINSFDYIISVMKRFIEKGLSFSVDDFGTGYSSLSYIGTLPVESIKLDKSFIDMIAESEVYLLIVKNVIEIAKGLRFKVVAEGVEKRRQFEILKQLGCDYIQGYLFSKPLPEKSFLAYLEENEIEIK